MQRKTLFIPGLGNFNIVRWSGENTSGYEVVGDRVLILPDYPTEKSSGGVFLPEDEQERLAHSATMGVLVGLGPDAFKWNSDRSRPFDSNAPQVGQRVYFERHSGEIIYGLDGKMYRLMDDRCIGAISVEQSAVEGADEGVAA